jgi:hypothetical protein
MIIRPRSAVLPALMTTVILGLFPLTARAQNIPVWFFAAALSPILVLIFCAVLGFLARSVITAVLHAAFVLLWVVLFALASYYVENDYVIWTPLALYILHTALLLALIVLAAKHEFQKR